jgi:hypothetical protein
LEMRAGWYRQRHARAELGDFFLVALLAPHPSPPRDDVPNLLDGAMGDGSRYCV